MDDEVSSLIVWGVGRDFGRDTYEIKMRLKKKTNFSD